MACHITISSNWNKVLELNYTPKWIFHNSIFKMDQNDNNTGMGEKSPWPIVFRFFLFRDLYSNTKLHVIRMNWFNAKAQHIPICRGRMRWRGRQEVHSTFRCLCNNSTGKKTRQNISTKHRVSHSFCRKWMVTVGLYMLPHSTHFLQSSFTFIYYYAIHRYTHIIIIFLCFTERDSRKKQQILMFSSEDFNSSSILTVLRIIDSEYKKKQLNETRV